MDLSLDIILQSPPAGIDFALQKGSGNQYQPMHVQRSAGGDLYFNLTATVKGDQTNDPLPDFKGPFIHGPLGGRFIYIDIGTAAGQDSPWTRRLKIPLTGITWKLIGELSNHPGSSLWAAVPGTAKDGGPNCATVKPFDGWKMKVPAG